MSAGMYYAQARYYAPGLGRFVAEDTIKGFVEFPQTLNANSYCWNRPMILVDLDGRLPQWASDARNWISDTWDGAMLIVEDIGSAIVHSVSANYSIGAGIGVEFNVINLVELDFLLAVNRQTTVDAMGTSYNWGFDLAGGITMVDYVGIYGHRRYIDLWQSSPQYNRDHPNYSPNAGMIIADSVTLVTPIETEFSYLATGSEASWQSDDFVVTIGQSIYFGFGGGFNFSFNFSEFGRRLRGGCIIE